MLLLGEVMGPTVGLCCWVKFWANLAYTWCTIHQFQADGKDSQRAFYWLKCFLKYKAVDLQQ
jgi:hypothetical protein